MQLLGFTVLRLLTPLKMSYEVAKKRAAPCTKIVEELPQMRRETVPVVRQAVSEGRRVYMLVNNGAEGNAPLTVRITQEGNASIDNFGKPTTREPRSWRLAGLSTAIGGSTSIRLGTGSW